MADLKAAAKWLKESATDSYVTDQQTGYLLLAAQALEAWAWQQEQGAWVSLDGDVWVCRWYDERLSQHTWSADTPLGAVLAAMEGERDA